jgi:hypothetical protein
MNALLDLADRQTPAPIKAKHRAAEKRTAKKAEQREQLNAAYRIWREERREALLAGAHGDAVKGLIAFLNSMSLRDDAALIEHAKAFRNGDVGTRLEVLV